MLTVWTAGVFAALATVAAAVGLESVTADAPDGTLTCEDDGVYVSNWDLEIVDGRINAVSIADIAEACSGAEIAASVADAAGTVIATTDGVVIDGVTELTLPFSPTRPRVADVEQLDVYIVGSGGPTDPPDDPSPLRVYWDGSAPTEVVCSGPVTWTFELTGKVNGYQAELSASFFSAGIVGPAPMTKVGGGRTASLVGAVTTPTGDTLHDAWATLNKTPDPSMTLSLLTTTCADG